MAEEEKDEHNKLFGYIGLLAVALIVLISGLLSLSWPTALIGALLSAFGAFEVKITYSRIQYENQSIQAKQSGQGNIQTNQTNPRHSPVIHAENVYYGIPKPDSEPREAIDPKTTRHERQVQPDDAEWLVNGEVRFQDYEEFESKLNKGDQLKGHVESKDPISVEIMDSENFEAFEEDDDEDNYGTLWSSPRTTDFQVSYTSTAKRTVHLVIIDELEDDDEESDEEAKAVARIKVIRKSVG